MVHKDAQPLLELCTSLLSLTLHEAHIKCLFREEHQVELLKRQAKAKKSTPSTYLAMELAYCAPTTAGKAYFHCYLIQNQFIYTRFSLTNNVQVEVISSLLEKTTGSLELQHLLEAQVCLITLLFRSSHLNRGVLESKQNNEDQYSGSSLQHEINFHPLNQLTGNTSIIWA